MNLNLINIISNLIKRNFNSIEVKSNLIYVHTNLMQVNFLLFQEILNLLKSYHINFLHIKYLRMVCIKKFSFKINNIIDNLSG